MSHILSKEKRKIYARKIKGFWIDYSHNKVGIAGIILLMIFVAMAAFAPVLAPGDPIHPEKVAAKYARPMWISVFNPSYNSKTPTLHFPFNVTLASENQSCAGETITLNYPQEWMFEIKYQNDGNLANQTYIFESKFNYTYDEPPEWEFNANWDANFEGLNYRFEINFTAANGSEWIVWGRDYDIVTKRVKVLKYHWNSTDDSMLTGSGTTALKRRIYYEKFYKQYLDYYLKKYPFVNLTFPPRFITFTYEGYKNVTSLPDPENPIYSTYSKLKREKQTTANWTEYWQDWINSTDAQEMWNLISEYVEDSWKTFVAPLDVQDFTNNPYLQWYYLRIPKTKAKYRDVLPWDEFVEIYNLTLTTVKDDYDVFVEAMNKTDLSSPAYERWITLWNDTELTWDLYLSAWINIQYDFAKPTFKSKYINALNIGPELAISRTETDAYNAAATSPKPTYYLAHKGTQALRLYVLIVPESENATLNLRFGNSGKLTVWGERYGLLGTTRRGEDVWMQLVHGARISLIVGSLCALLSTTLGILFGVSAGYLGGIADEVTMRIVDILLCLPVLPILLALSAIWKPNVYYLVIIIAIFGWQGLSRMIRSRVLSLREMPFIESAKASGAGSSYLIIRHLIPNVFPLAMASLVLSVPGAILVEAAWSYLGFGDPFAPTWGRMLHHAQDEGAFMTFKWWYILPPGFAITFLCLAFVFIGHALDEIVNPRLRRRR